MGPGAEAVYRRADRLASRMTSAAEAAVGLSGNLISRGYAEAMFNRAADALTTLERYCANAGVTTPRTASNTDATDPSTFTALSQRWRHDYRDDVLAVQQRLNDLGYGWVDPDGYYGPLTEAAVETFQQFQGLTVDGVVGPQTWQALFADPDTQSMGPGNDGLIVDRDGEQSLGTVPLPPPSAVCADGTRSYSQHRPGTCSWHGGVGTWLN